jgi:hypothetical protein
MIFWLAVLVGGLFAWIAVRIGFSATWIMFFNLLVAVYVAIFLAPVVIVDIPAATAIPGYGYALTLMSIAVATLFITYGTCYACLSGQLHVEFPRFLDTIVAGLLGFLAGFLIWSFLTFAFCLTPLSQIEFCKRLGLDAQSQAAHTSYVCWWCNRVHSFVSYLGDESTSQQAVAVLIEKATARAASETKAAAPPDAPPPPAPLAPAPAATAESDANKVPAYKRKKLAGDKKEGEIERESAAGQQPPQPGPGAGPTARPKESLKEELSRRRVILHSPDDLRAAVADPEIRIIDVADACSSDRFDPAQTTLLQKWVSNGGILWANSSVLSLFGMHYSRLVQGDDVLECVASEAVDVAPIVAECKKVMLNDAGGKANIQASKGAMPLLLLENDSPGKHKAGTACWSLVPYGKGWISDPKSVDTKQYDGAQFWQNFCRFCLGKDPAE